MGLGVAVAFLLIYMPDLLAYKQQFSELRQIAKERSELDSLLKQPLDKIDPKWIEAAKVFPYLEKKNGREYISKGFFKIPQKLPGSRFLRFVLLGAISLTLFVFTTAIFMFFSKKSVLDLSEPPKKNRDNAIILWLPIAGFLVLMSLPNILLFGFRAKGFALPAFYSALFTWLFHLKRCPYYVAFDLERHIRGKGIPESKAKQVWDYYMGLLKFMLLVFTGVSISLGWSVSGIVSEPVQITPSLTNYGLVYLFLQDIYGTAWLLGGVGSELGQSLADVVKHTEA
jgi:hypothetical protein